MAGEDLDRVGPNKTKIDRYGWTVRDAPGQLRYIGKNQLTVDYTYQRTHSAQKVRNLARDWSWMACGAILVAKRNGQYYVVDGQHRVLAAKSRADIIDLPCILFETDAPSDEAVAWLGANKNRKVPDSVDTFRALVAARDPDAMYMQETCDRLGIVITKAAGSPKRLKSVVGTIRILKRNRDQFDKLMPLLAELCENCPLSEKLVAGLDYIGQHLDLDEPRLRKRLLSVGPEALVRGATRAAAYFVRGGANVWAMGMMDEINKGLRTKFEFPLSPTEPGVPSEEPSGGSTE